MVRDDAHIFDGDIGQVVSAAEELQNSGAQVYVRTFPTTGDQPTVDRLEHSMQDQCPGWQNADSGRKTNLVVIMYADKDSAGKHSLLISTGPGVDKLVPNREIDRIRARIIIPQIKAGRAAQGFAQGLTEIKTAYEAQPVTASTGTSQAVPQQTPAPQPTKDTDLSRLWAFLGYVLLLLALVIGYYLYGERKRRRAAKQKAIETYNAVTGQINAIDGNFENLQNFYQALAANLSAAEQQTMEKEIAAVKKTYEDACADFGTKHTFDLEKGLRRVEEYEDAGTTYQEILEKLKSIAEPLGQADRHLRDLQQQIDSAPGKLQEAQATAKNLEQQLKEVNQAGFRTEAYEQWLAQAEKLANETGLALKSGQAFDVSGKVTKIEELLKQASPGAKLPDTRVKLENDLTSVKSRIDQAKSSVQECKPAIDRMDTTCARQSFESVAGNGSQAVEHINWCDRAVPVAEDCITMEKQDWQKGAEIIAEANGHLDRADSLVRSIISIEKSLNVARVEAPADIQSAEQDLAKAEEYLNTNKADIHEAVSNKVSSAKEAIANAKAELRKPKPDYFEVVKSAKQGHGTADDILSEARSEHESAERLREKAATTLRDATSRVSKAREYIEDNRRYVTYGDLDEMKEAETHLLQAQSANTKNDLEATIKWAEQADEAGKSVYNHAKDHVDEQTRPDAYQQANHYYAPSHTTILVNNNSYSSVGAGQSFGSALLSALFSGSGSSSSSSWSSSGSNSSSSWSSPDSGSSSSGGSDSSSSW